MPNLMWAVILTVLIQTGLIVALRRGYVFLGLTDKPCTRKKHTGAIPYSGGLALSLPLAPLVYFAHLGNLIGFLVFISWIIFLVSFWDDIQGLSSKFRLFVQFLTGATFFVVCAWMHPFLTSGSWLPIILTAILFIISASGIVNAFNMSDGVDGLCGSLLSLAFMSFCYIAYVNHNVPWFIFAYLLSISLLVFVGFNLSTRHKVFLGDNGSATFGFIVAGTLLSFSFVYHFIHFGVALWFIACPLMGMGRVILLRLSQGVSPFKADRKHFHHMMIDNKLSKTSALIAITICQLFFCLIGFALYYLRVSSLFSLLALLFVFILFFTVTYPSYMEKLLGTLSKNTINLKDEGE